MCNFLEYKGLSSLQHHIQSSIADPFLLDTKVVYRRYASLFFIAGCSSTDNELITLEIVHRYVEQMDKYYGNVCELDIIFNFQKAYFILDELLLAGEMQESSKKNVLRCIGQQDSLEDMDVFGRKVLSILFYFTFGNGLERLTRLRHIRSMMKASPSSCSQISCSGSCIYSLARILLFAGSSVCMHMAASLYQC